MFSECIWQHLLHVNGTVNNENKTKTKKKRRQPVEQQMKNIPLSMNKTSNLLEGLRFGWLTTIVYDLTPCYDFERKQYDCCSYAYGRKESEVHFFLFVCVYRECFCSELDQMPTTRGQGPLSPCQEGSLREARTWASFSSLVGDRGRPGWPRRTRFSGHAESGLSTPST